MAGIKDSRVVKAMLSDRVWQLMAANLLVFIALHVSVLLGAGDEQIAMAVALPALPEAFIRVPWTLATYMFAQWDFFHLLFNMLWLWSFGMMLTRMGESGMRVVKAYIAGGLVAGALWVALGALHGGGGILVGSSGAVLAVIGAAGVILGRRRVQMMLFGVVQVRWLAAGVVVLCLLFDSASGSAATVAVHGAGALAGALYAVVAMRRNLRPVRKTPPAPSWSAVRRPARRGLDATEQANLDALLLKVRNGGYSALSAAEKKQLFDLSSKIK